MSLRNVAHLRRALDSGTVDVDTLRQALARLWDAVEALESGITASRRSVVLENDEVALRAGSASITLKKSGEIAISTTGRIDVKSSADTLLMGRKIAGN